MFNDYFFWFAQPSSILSQFDYSLGYFFGAILLVAVLLWLAKKFLKNSVDRKLLRKFQGLLFHAGLWGLVWFGFRYENTPIFARRYWVAVIVILALVRLAFIIKYLVVSYRSEKFQLERELIKNKYLAKR